MSEMILNFVSGGVGGLAVDVVFFLWIHGKYDFSL